MNSSRIGGILFLLLSGCYGYFAGEIPLDFWSEQEPFNARSMPGFIAIAGIVVSILLIAAPSAKTDWGQLQHMNWRPAALLLVMMSVYGLAFEYLGFVVSTIVFLIVSFIVLGERRVAPMVLVAIPLVGGFWLILKLLGIHLETGAWLEALAVSRGF